jgi:hypothetical protein
MDNIIPPGLQTLINTANKLGKVHGTIHGDRFYFQTGDGAAHSFCDVIEIDPKEWTIKPSGNDGYMLSDYHPAFGRLWDDHVEGK